MKLFRYLFKDKVDLILLLFIVAMSVKNFTVTGKFEFVNALLILYILGTMYRMGALWDLLNNNVTVRKLRQDLKLHPIPGEINPIRRKGFGLVVYALFWVVLIGILTLYILR